MSSNDTAELLVRVRSKGVRLWSQNGELHYRAPKGALSRDELDRLAASQSEIVAFLDRAPLGLSQLSRWQLLEAGEVTSLRQVAFALRLSGRLNSEALCKSVAEIVRHHDALRTVIVVSEGTPFQKITRPGDYDLQVDDLTQLPPEMREARLTEAIEQIILERIDIAVGPLFAARLLKLDDDEHVLVVALEHLISDGFSRSILLRDLFIAYAQLLNGHPVALPKVSMQFADYTSWQRSVDAPSLERHAAYWRERLAGCGRMRFPEHRSSPTGSDSGWHTLPIQIDCELRTQLSASCRTMGTTLAMSVFTAYVALVLRWCNESDGVFRYQSDGRVRPQVHNTIGFFAAELYLRLSLSENDSFIELMSRVTQEYCLAYEHVEWVDVAVQMPRPEFTRNTLFNWVPKGPKVDVSHWRDSPAGLTCSPVSFTHPMLRNMKFDSEPSILLFDNQDEIVGNVHFPLRFPIATMQRFSRNFRAYLVALATRPDGRLRDIPLV